MHRCGAAAWASVSHVICAIGFAPHPPLLIPEVASGAAVELDDLRESCDGVVRELVESSDELLIVGSAQGVGIGEWLAARHQSTYTVRTMAAEQHPADIADALADAQKSAHHVAVLAMGDGAACRSEKAPGYLDERSFEFDDSIATALQQADATALSAIDVDLARQLLAAGRTVWPAIGRVVSADAREWTGDLCFRADPYGVSYFVALWRPGG